MKEERYFYVPNANETTFLPDDEAVHATRVLRMTEGEKMFLMDGKGSFYEAVVSMASKKACAYHIVQTLPQEKKWRGHIHLAIAPTKMMDRMEWMIEKAVEVGVDEITLLNCHFSERTKINIERLERIVVSAMKQSRKPWKPILHGITSFDTFISQPGNAHKFIAHCYDEVSKVDLFDSLQGTDDAPVVMLVGPEGDFSIDEVQRALVQGYTSVTLGHSRLRTETAGLAAVMYAHLNLRLP